jgi:hypothetical protein
MSTHLSAKERLAHALAERNIAEYKKITALSHSGY